MIIEDKNKLKSKIRSKILVLGLIIVFVVIGLFSPVVEVWAYDSVNPGTCMVQITTASGQLGEKLSYPNKTEKECHDMVTANSGIIFVRWDPTTPPPTCTSPGVPTADCIPPLGGYGNPATGACWVNGVIVVTVTTSGACTGTWQNAGDPNPGPPNGPTANSSGTTTYHCVKASDGTLYDRIAPATCDTGDAIAGTTTTPPAEQQTGQQEDPKVCRLFPPNIPGCLNAAALVVMGLSNWVLWAVGQIFNFIIQLALGGGIYSNPFILKAWAILRDLANLFFIFILLYTAIKIILDLDAGGAKKTIAQIVIMAMLINFSMFFTNVVIDTSNILAMIFYNKIGAVVTTNGTPYSSVAGEKDLSGGILASIGKLPGDLADGHLIEAARDVKPASAAIGSAAAVGIFEVMMGLALQMWGILLLLIGIVVFIIIVLAFLNRIVTLMALIIFSPFAFMSTTLPLLRKMDYLGWDDWINRLFKAAFFAPIFMFFLFIIFLMAKPLLGIITTPLQGGGFVQTIISLTFGFSFVMTLLYMAIHFAYKASGKAGELFVAGVKVAAVAGLAVATAGAGLAVSGAVGGAASKVLNNPALQKAALLGDKGAMRKIWWANKANNFDTTAAIHGLTGGKLKSSLFDRVSGATGLDERISTKGGHKGVVERTAQRRREEGELYKTTETNDEVRRRTKEEQVKYDRKKEEALEAKNRSGAAMVPEEAKEEFNRQFEEDYKKQYGERPEVFKTTEAYNNDLQKKFQKSLGTRDTLGMIAQARLKADDKIIDKTNCMDDWDYQEGYKEKHGRDATAADSLDTNISEKLNHERIMKERVVIGGTQARGEFKYSRELDKQFTQMKNVEDRITDMKKLLEKQTGVLKEGMNLKLKDQGGKELKDLVVDTKRKDSLGNAIYSIDENKLREALSVADVDAQDLKNRLETKNKAVEEAKAKKLDTKGLEDDKIALKKEMYEFTIKTAKLNALKGMDQTTANTRVQIFNLTGQKTAMNDSGKSSPKNTPPPPPPPPNP